jgi:hypothetical protein
VKFAALVARERDHVGEEAAERPPGRLQRSRNLEIAFHVALNTLTTYVNEVAKTDVDLPMVHARQAA